jgi:deoxyribose-phosphate aldolase
MSLTDSEIARLLDHSCLSPTAPAEEFTRAIQVARDFRVATLCVPSFFVAHASRALQGSGVGTCSTIGFPHGNASTGAKLKEAEVALQDGASELDLVVNLSWVKSADYGAIGHELRAFADMVRAHGGRSKLIFEMCYLELNEKERLLELASEVGLDFVKTSTGFGSGGATLDDVRLMRARCPAHVQVKASGGIRTRDAVLAFHAAGATRIGTSSTAAILAPGTNELRAESGY